MTSNSTTPGNPATLKIRFPFKGGFYAFQPDQIIRLEADSNYTFIHVRDRKPILMAKVLSAYESLLAPFGFIRTHRSHLVNSLHINAVDHSGQIIMDDNSVAELSRRKRKTVYRMLIQNDSAA